MFFAPERVHACTRVCVSSVGIISVKLFMPWNFFHHTTQKFSEPVKNCGVVCSIMGPAVM